MCLKSWKLITGSFGCKSIKAMTKKKLQEQTLTPYVGLSIYTLYHFSMPGTGQVLTIGSNAIYLTQTVIGILMGWRPDNHFLG